MPAYSDYRCGSIPESADLYPAAQRYPLCQASVVQLEQIRTIDKSRIDNYLGKVTPREMVAIEKALSVSLAMEQLKKRSPKHKAKRAKE